MSNIFLFALRALKSLIKFIAKVNIIFFFVLLIYYCYYYFLLVLKLLNNKIEKSRERERDRNK